MFALIVSLLVAAAVPSAATSRALTATGPGVTFPCLSVQQARVCSIPPFWKAAEHVLPLLRNSPLLTPCLAPICAAPHPYRTCKVFDQWNISTLPALARASGTYEQLVAGNQTLLVPIDSSYPAHFGANSTTDKLAGYVLYNVIPGQFPTHSLHNLQRLYGRLPGVDVAVKIPRVHAGGHIQILGIYGNTIGRIVHKNLTACGSVYIHLLDAPVLPYTVK